MWYRRPKISALQGNARRDVCFMWETLNMAFVSGGATKRCIESIGAVAHRRFFFWFKTSDELKVVLYLSYYAGREFFADSSRFSAA